VVRRRSKLTCRRHAGAAAQAPPPWATEGGIPKGAMVTDILLARYVDHLGRYRQAQILARQCVNLDRSTVSVYP
jgi:transposase